MADIVVGQKITSIRHMTKEELVDEGWELCKQMSTVAIVLSNGTIIYPSADDEGNGPGVLFGKTKDVGGIYIHP